MYEIDKARFGAFVAGLRREGGMTQKELAQRLFVSDKAVSKWERGLSMPDVALLAPLSELLGVTVTELLRGQRTQERETLEAGEVERLVSSRRAALRRRTARSCPAAEGVAAGLGAVRPGGGGGGGAAAGHGLLLGRDGEHGAAGSHAVRALRSMAVLFGAGRACPGIMMRTRSAFMGTGSFV